MENLAAAGNAKCRGSARLISLSVTCKKEASSRPSLDDVERISQGNAAKARGTGSRRIPHRLNAEERQQYEIAKQKGFLTLRGTGYRKERKGSPLANTFRQWCDAQASLCVVIEQGFGINAMDTVLVDMSTLRRNSVEQVKERCTQMAADHQCSMSEAQTTIPFTIEVSPKEAVIISGRDIDAAGQGPGLPDAEGSEHQQEAHQPKSSSSSSPLSMQADVQDDVHTGNMLSVPEQQHDYTILNSKERKRLASSSPTAPIWTVPADPVFFDADRPTAKQLAKSLVAIPVDQLLHA